MFVEDCNGSFGTRDRLYEDLTLLLTYYRLIFILVGDVFKRMRIYRIYLALEFLSDKVSPIVRVRMSRLASSTVLLEHFRAHILGSSELEKIRLNFLIVQFLTRCYILRFTSRSPHKMLSITLDDTVPRLIPLFSRLGRLSGRGGSNSNRFSLIVLFGGGHDVFDLDLEVTVLDELVLR